MCFPNYLLTSAYLGDSLTHNQHNMRVCSQGSALLSCRVISNDINKYDKHLSWSCSQWKPVWFNIKRHISANRRKRESFISDKWGGEEFWKFPLGCNNNWSQISLLYMWGENTGGLTYLIGHVKTTPLGQEESENALGKHDTHSTHHIHGRTNKTYRLRQVEHTLLPGLTCHYQTSACHCCVENMEENENNKS